MYHASPWGPSLFPILRHRRREPRILGTGKERSRIRDANGRSRLYVPLPQGLCSLESQTAGPNASYRRLIGSRLSGASSFWGHTPRSCNQLVSTLPPPGHGYSPFLPAFHIQQTVSGDESCRQSGARSGSTAG